MVVDSSALIAVLLSEPESQQVLDVIYDATAGSCYISAATLLEAHIVIHNRLGSKGIEELNILVNRLGINIENFRQEHVALALEAYKRYSASPARLNFGDCFSYALAKARNEPLLCKGNDFKNTDLQIANY